MKCRFPGAETTEGTMDGIAVVSRGTPHQKVCVWVSLTSVLSHDQGRSKTGLPWVCRTRLTGLHRPMPGSSGGKGSADHRPRWVLLLSGTACCDWDCRETVAITESDDQRLRIGEPMVETGPWKVGFTRLVKSAWPGLRLKASLRRDPANPCWAFFGRGRRRSRQWIWISKATAIVNFWLRSLKKSNIDWENTKKNQISYTDLIPDIDWPDLIKHFFCWSLNSIHLRGFRKYVFFVCIKFINTSNQYWLIRPDQIKLLLWSLNF